MLYKNIYLPIEIQIYILSKITDTIGYKNARIVCKDWYRELKILKIFNNRKMIKYLTFSPKEILVYNSNNQMIEQTIFKLYGEFNHYTYKNKARVKTINCNPLKTVETIYYNDFPYKKIIYNFKNENLENIFVPFPFAFPHPVQGNMCNIS